MSKRPAKKKAIAKKPAAKKPPGKGRAQPTRFYPPKLKDDAVAYARKHSVKAAAKKYNLKEGNIYRWARSRGGQFGKSIKRRTSSNNGKGPASQPGGSEALAELQAQLKQLEQENALLRLAIADQAVADARRRYKQ